VSARETGGCRSKTTVQLILFEGLFKRSKPHEKRDWKVKERKIFWSTISLAALFCTSASAQIIRPDSWQMCGPAINRDQVMVLDLRMFGGRDIGGQRAFIKKHAGNYSLAHKDMLIVLVPQPAGPTDVDAPLVQSQIEAAKRGCDLVLVHRTEIRDSADAGGWFASADVQFGTRSR
jgi:hypothetical protein